MIEGKLLPNNWINIPSSKITHAVTDKSGVIMTQVEPCYKPARVENVWIGSVGIIAPFESANDYGNSWVFTHFTEGERYGTVMNKLTECEGIPLTEEWLAKLGFVHNSDISNSAWEAPHPTGLFYFSAITTAVNKIFIVQLAFPGDNGSYYYPHGESAGCQYVHQLQNLYFALTGKELQCQ